MESTESKESLSYQHLLIQREQAALQQRHNQLEQQRREVLQRIAELEKQGETQSVNSS